MRCSGYFGDGGRGRSHPSGIKEGCCLAGSWIKPLKLRGYPGNEPWSCLALGSLERSAGDGGAGTAGRVLSPRWWPEPARRRKALKVTVAERIQRERADENQAVWAGSDFGWILSHGSKQPGTEASERAACLLLLTEGLNHSPRAVKNDSRSFASQWLE